MTSSSAAPAAAIAAAALACPALAAAFPDGPPWEVAGNEGCVQCHFDAPATEDSEALSLAGLPSEVTPGSHYRLTVRLTAPEMAIAGFLLSAWHEAAPPATGDAESPAQHDGAGAFAALDAKTTANGAQVRSTEAGSVVETPGVAEWSVEWTAPTTIDGPIVVELWANAGNNDQSPFGDATHRRVWTIRPAPAGAPRY
ncbi:MAG TPA: choice-of-anchor V domain-containing protein [Gammaproteobacteria bacterium]